MPYGTDWLPRVGLCVATALALVFPRHTLEAQANTVVYNCSDGTSVNAIYDIGASTLTLEVGDALTIRLDQAVSGSGLRYVAAGGYEAYGKANWLNIIRPNQPELKCTEIGRVDPPDSQTAQPGLPPPFQPQPSLPQQTASPSFNCAGRLKTTEARICANPMLATLDRKMAFSYSWLLGQLPPGQRGELKQDQRSWIGQRNGCGANDSCIEGQVLGRTAYLNEYLQPGSALAPSQPQGGGFAAKSWGGIVRSGPGQQFARIASLNEGESIIVLQQARQSFQDRPWFKIRFRGRTGYHWAGIICPIGQVVPGTFQVCK
jgi:uncharacterized protein YecT (DUF1311 family)/membrane-bound inhibitor of C-type lysozyme